MRLCRTPVHKSEKFWKESLRELEADDFKVLRCAAPRPAVLCAPPRDLANVLQTATDAVVLCVALFDFGQFVKYSNKR